MSVALPNNKKEKRQRLQILANQGSIGYTQAGLLYLQYCQLYNKVKK